MKRTMWHESHPLGFVGLMAVSLWVGCLGVETRSVFHETRDVSSLQTYSWAAGTREKFATPGLADYTAELVDAQLAARGYEKTEGPSDFVVHAHPSEDEEYHQTVSGPVVQFDEGALQLEFRDGSTGELLWQGVGRDYLPPEEKADSDRYEIVNESIEELFENFPDSQGR